MVSITIAEQRREQAIPLRRAGRSRREIKEILGITSNETLDKALKGEPPPAWTLRPRAKDELRARARELREQGLDYGVPQTLSRGLTPLLGGRTPTPRGSPGSGPRRGGRRDRPPDRPRDPHRRPPRPLVRRRKEQTAPTRGTGELHQQRS